jgi:hypothetical protein
MRSRMPGMASSPKVRGRTKATPMVAVRPGREPMQIPVNTPRIMKRVYLHIKYGVQYFK